MTLRSRRARLSPDGVGLPDDGRARRVPGLRHDEVARPAGVSTGYYTRLEQGRAGSPSPEVGELRFSYESFLPPGDAGQMLCVHNVEPGSPTADALRLLSSWAAPGAPDDRRPGDRMVARSSGQAPAMMARSLARIVFWRSIPA